MVQIHKKTINCTGWGSLCSLLFVQFPDRFMGRTGDMYTEEQQKEQYQIAKGEAYTFLYGDGRERDNLAACRAFLSSSAFKIMQTDEWFLREIKKVLQNSKPSGQICELLLGSFERVQQEWQDTWHEEKDDKIGVLISEVVDEISKKNAMREEKRKMLISGVAWIALILYFLTGSFDENNMGVLKIIFRYLIPK